MFKLAFSTVRLRFILERLAQDVLEASSNGLVKPA